ncbi:MAG: hypothetical protein AVDCRST_MAG16-2414, partial [uncultured Frankineae bacterium]
ARPPLRRSRSRRRAAGRCAAHGVRCRGAGADGRRPARVRGAEHDGRASRNGDRSTRPDHTAQPDGHRPHDRRGLRRWPGHGDVRPRGGVRGRVARPARGERRGRGGARPRLRPLAARAGGGRGRHPRDRHAAGRLRGRAARGGEGPVPAEGRM